MPTDVPLMAELPLWLQLNKVSKKYMDALAARLGHLGIKRHYFLLVAIGEGKSLLTQQQLADLLEVDKVTMVGILDSLVRGGFVRRTKSEEDRREHRIVLTPKAERALPEIRRTIRDLNRRALAGTPSAFQAQFPAALLAMKRSLAQIIHGTEEGASPPSRRKPRARKAA